MRSVSFGIWVGVGSRDETRPQAGVSHFLEHLLFKGTQQAQRAGHLGRDRGGRRRDQRLHHQGIHLLLRPGAGRGPPLAIDVMCDLVADSVLAPADVETERGVILEEIAMHDDEPGDEVHDLFAEAIYGDRHPLGRLISGTEDTITPMTREQIQSLLPAPLHARHRWSSRRPATWTTTAWSSWSGEAFARSGSTARRRTSRRPRRPAARRAYTSRPAIVRDKDTEQAHLVLGCPGSAGSTSAGSRSACSTTCSAAACPAGCSRRSGRQRGLAYSVYSYTSRSTPTAGLFGVYAGCAPGKVDEVLDLIRAELAPGGRPTASPRPKSSAARA